LTAFLVATTASCLAQQQVHLDEVQTSKHWSGYLALNRSKSSSGLFYYFVEADTEPLSKPLVIWLQGGPGCSGMLALFQEIGPFFLLPNETLAANPFAWNSVANVLYLDQPVGTGYSFVNDTKELAQDLDTVANDLGEALRDFHATFPWTAKQKLFLTGESYAGKYIPSFATWIMNNAPEVLLAGLAMGDAWVSPLAQTSVLAEQGYMLGLIDRNEMDVVQERFTECQTLVDSQQWRKAADYCDAIQDYIVNASGGVNINDVRSFGTSLPDFLNRYLNRSDVKAAMHVPDFVDYNVCPDPPFEALRTDEMMCVKDLLPPLLARYPVLIYNGQFDLNCGIAGTETYLLSLQWPEAAAYRKAKKHIWRVEGDVAGYVRSAGRLTQLTVVDSGHLVPKNQPLFALRMLSHLIDGTPFE